MNINFTEDGKSERNGEMKTYEFIVVYYSFGHEPAKFHHHVETGNPDKLLELFKNRVERRRDCVRIVNAYYKEI